jgi:alpha-glucosidase
MKAQRALQLAALLFPLSLSAQTVASPDKTIQVTITPQPFSYNVKFHATEILLPSPLGIELKDQPTFQNLHTVGENRHAIDRTWTPAWGKSTPIRDRANELTLTLEEASAPRRRLQLIVRASDDGVAFRYNLPGTGNFTLTRELTGFHFAPNTTTWASSYKSFRTSYEQEYPERKLTTLPENSLLGLPLLTQTNNAYVAITEADLTDYAGMYLTRNGDTLSASLSPRTDGNGLVHGVLPHDTPWRVLLLGATPGALIESNLVENLSPPSVLADTSWIHPGMMAWDHWWSGDVLMTMEQEKRYITFASQMGFPYQLVDWQWYGTFNSPAALITQPAPQIDMPELLSFAREKHVRLWLWIHSGDIDRALRSRELDADFSTYESWGIAGVKIDFMDSDDQDRVNWYQTVVSLAAAHHLMVDFHGAFKPTGLRVNYPNLLTREGVLGNEYNKFSTRVTPTHKLTLPFTRMLAGPMDYTPGGFLNRSPAEWKQTTPTQVMGSRAQELALFVVYWSPLTCVTDDPDHYNNQPGLAFLRDVPTVWDETRVLDGSVGHHIVIARRKGADWFLGGMTGDTAYDLDLPLHFLGKGNYTAQIYADPTDPKASYEALTITTRQLRAKDKLHLHLRPAGGVAVRLHLR